MDRRSYDQDRYNKLYDIIELIYILDRLSNKHHVDEKTKNHLICMLKDVDSIRRNNFDRHREIKNYGDVNKLDYSKDDYFPSKSESTIDKIIYYLKSLND